MLKPYTRLVAAAILAACSLPAVVVIASPAQEATVRRVTFGAEPWTAGQKATDVLWLASCGLALGALAIWLIQSKWQSIDAIARGQAACCDTLPQRLVRPTIIVAAALSLYLELMLIRWHGTVFELFAYYKNLSLLACFLGLGLGYALARRAEIPLLFVLPLLVCQFGLLPFLRDSLGDVRRASLDSLPVIEQLGMGITTTRSLAGFVAIYWFLAALFALSALSFVPIGQLCGRLMDRAPRLEAYSLNLIGSLVGVGLAFLASAFWLPPVVWFAIGLGGLLCFQWGEARSRTLSLTGYVAAITLLAWPHGITWERIYSPYQLIERGPGEHGHSLIRAAGQYYQRIHNLSSEVIETTRDEGQRLTAAYYEFPYRVFPTPRRDVAIVGAGTGNDVAAALRTGAGHVDAVEIDPAIILLGKMYHPERPFDNPRVRVISDDARAFFRAGGTSYDLIVFGLLDSHTLLSHASNVRLDSFVYTVEGLREARARLEPDGVIALSFSVLSPELGRKIHLMLEQAFDGRPPRAFRGRYNYDGSVIFLARNSDAVTIPPDALSAGGFRDVTSTYADPLLQADPSTDDWPFFYMPRRVYPLSYLGVVGLLLALSILLIARLIPDRPTRGDWPFFLMGAGFMLLQTKGITELALAYGNTWRVVGIVIVAMLGFAFLANLIVERRGVMDPRWALLGVIVALLLGLWQTRTYGPGSSAFGRWGATLLVASPVFFSGLAFSGLLLRAENLSRVLAANLLGSLVGGLLEYNSMYFGFQFLHILAAVIYGLAFIAISIPVKASRLPLPQRSIQSG